MRANSALLQQDAEPGYANLQFEVSCLSDTGEYMLRKCSNVAQILSEVLEFKTKRDLEKQTKLTFELTKQGVDDSVVVKVITIITLVYLSSTTVAVRILSSKFADVHLLTYVNVGNLQHAILLSRSSERATFSFASSLDILRDSRLVDCDKRCVLALAAEREED